MNHIRLIAADQEWNGSYTIRDGNVCVASAYGAERAPIEREEQAEAVALEIFERVVKRKYPAYARVTLKPGRPYSARR